MAKTRLLGVYGANLPTKKSGGVVASDFLIGGIVGMFERKFDAAFACRSPQEVRAIFGNQFSASVYGWDAVSGFFSNSAGVNAKLYISSHVGYTGSALDAVTAFQNLADGTPASVLKLEDAYQNQVGYGVSGNRIGVTVTNGARVTSSISTNSLATDLFVYVSAPGNFRVGDLIKVVATGGGGATVWKKITSIDENVKKLFFAAAFHGSATPAQTDVVTAQAFQIKTFRKALTGLVEEVDTEIGKVWLSTEPENVQFYAPTIFAASSWLKVSRLSTTPATLDKTFPIDVAVPVYCTSGADGTSPTTAAHWNRALTRLDNLPVRFIANPETTTVAIQQAIETYGKARWDTPKAIINLAENQTKSQLTVLGQNYMRSDDVLMLIAGQWLKVTDPFNSSINAPARNVPNVGHVMGLVMRVIGTKGIHYSPGMKDSPLYGVTDVVGDQMLADTDRTDLADVGVNCIQNLAGYGVVLRNAFAPSGSVEFRFINGLIMRDYIKVSAVDSLQESENTPNSLSRIAADKMAILSFLYRLWSIGSNGGSPTGETFGQTTINGSPTNAEDHFQVQADAVNNPQIEIQAGNRNLDVWFTYPAPAGSIRIGVGILLLG